MTWGSTCGLTNLCTRRFPSDPSRGILDPSPSSCQTPGVTGKRERRRRRGDECEDMEEEEEGEEGERLVTPLGEDLVTLSTLPKSRWSNLQNLDIIKKRNRPLEPPKQPKATPFFLPTLAGLVPEFVTRGDEGDIPNVEAAASKILDLGKLEPLSPFQRTLEDTCVTRDYAAVIDQIRGMSPSTIDKEFRSLSPEAGGHTHTHSERQLLCLLRALLHQLRSRREFELTQAYLGLALKLHSRAISQSQQLTAVAKELLETQASSWQQLQEDLNMAGCLLAYFKSATVY
ncbi:WD repeat-containing protein 36 [Geodia barretti]|uniref:WD repeat-containing protein 36 n=1 Tax=Geodia barretti TaxID=519541 RepID=A0AA35SE73_GEOBA|nr:WD repeat-containing protein 36 [Geodia barretti]